MTNSRLCPYCEYPNATDAQHCARCHMPFVFKTTLELSARQPLEPEELGAVNAIKFFVPGITNPLIVERQDEMTLGRGLPGEEGPSIDLTPFQAHSHGVSRQHARIKWADNRYTIEDLGSTNGSQLNGKKLKPHEPQQLSNGDQLQLARLTLFVYFDRAELPKQSKPLSQVVALVDRSIRIGSSFVVTYDYLENTVMPYLKATVGIQTNLTKAEEAVQISKISIDETRIAITVTLSGAPDAIDVIRNYVKPWRRNHAVVINRHWGIELVPTTTTLQQSSLPSTSAADSKQKAIKVLEAVTDQLQEHYPSLDKDQLLPHLEAVAFSHLEMLAR